MHFSYAVRRAGAPLISLPSGVDVSSPAASLGFRFFSSRVVTRGVGVGVYVTTPGHSTAGGGRSSWGKNLSQIDSLFAALRAGSRKSPWSYYTLLASLALHTHLCYRHGDIS